MITRTVFQYGSSTRWLYDAAIKTDEDMMKWVRDMLPPPMLRIEAGASCSSTLMDAVSTG